MVAALEATIDRLTAVAPLPDFFIVPGGCPPSAALDLARSVVRRSERSAVAMQREGLLPDSVVLRYLNRLSDLLFILARTANPGGDVLWEPGAHSGAHAQRAAENGQGAPAAREPGEHLRDRPPDQGHRIADADVEPVDDPARHGHHHAVDGLEGDHHVGEGHLVDAEVLLERGTDHGQRGAVSPHRRLHDIRDVAPIIGLIEVLELLAGELLVLRQVEVTAVMHALDFLESERATEIELHIERRSGVMCQFFLGVLVEL